MAAGIVFAVIFIFAFCGRQGFKEENTAIITLSAVIFGLVGAKLLSIFTRFSPSEIKGILFSAPLSLLTESGLVFYGGLIAGIPAAYIAARKVNEKIGIYENIFITALPAAHAFGRIGCFFAGCCYGCKTSLPVGVIYTDPISDAPTGIPLFPIQLFEAGYNAFIFFILLAMLIKIPEKKLNLPIYFICYGTERFFAEMFRADDIRGFYFGLSTSQWISIAVIFFGIAILTVRLLKLRHCQESVHK